METKLVNLHFELIVEVEDNAAQPEIMEAASAMMQDLFYDNQLSAEALTENNLTSIDEYVQMKEGKWFNAVLAKNQLARMAKKDTHYSSEQITECLLDIEKVLGTGNQPSINEIFNSDIDI